MPGLTTPGPSPVTLSTNGATLTVAAGTNAAAFSSALDCRGLNGGIYTCLTLAGTATGDVAAYVLTGSTTTIQASPDGVNNWVDKLAITGNTNVGQINTMDGTRVLDPSSNGSSLGTAGTAIPCAQFVIAPLWPYVRLACKLASLGGSSNAATLTANITAK